MKIPFNNSGLSVVFLSQRFFALFTLHEQRRDGKKSFKVFTSEEGGSAPFLPVNADRKLFKKIAKTDIIVIPDIQLLHPGKLKNGDVTISNSIIDDLSKYLQRMGVARPVITSSLASPEILFHYYSRKLKFFPDDRTFILSGDDEMVFEARLRGRGLAAARLIDYETFKSASHSYTDCDHLISFSADPYSFRFEEEVASIGHPSLSQGSDESFTLQEGTREGKTWKGIYNICEMVSELHFTHALPAPGLLTPVERERSEANRIARTGDFIDLASGLVLGAVTLFIVAALVRLFLLSGWENDLDEFSKKQPTVYSEVELYGGKLPLIPGSKYRLNSLDSGFVKLGKLILELERHAETANIQITGLSLREKNFILIKGYAETPASASSLAERIKGAQLLSSEIYRSGEDVYTSFRIVVPGGGD